jgi:hypothetical protein
MDALHEFGEACRFGPAGGALLAMLVPQRRGRGRLLTEQHVDGEIDAFGAVHGCSPSLSASAAGSTPSNLRRFKTAACTRDFTVPTGIDRMSAMRSYFML